MLARSLSKEQEALHHLGNVGHPRNAMTTHLCDFLHCLGLHHFLNLLRHLVQKIFKWCKGLFSQLWVNMSTYFFLDPPLILFSINIVLFALVLTFISLYGKVVEVSESGEEWKGFLQSFSKLELCIVPFNPNLTTNQNPTTIKLQMNTHSIPISLSVSPQSELSTVTPMSQLHLSRSMLGRHLGLEGEHSQVPINVTLSFRNTWNSSACDISKLVPCQFTNITGCISFQAPRNIFPENKHVEHCPRELKLTQGSHYYAGLNWQIPDMNPLYYCRSRSMIKATFDKFLSKTNRKKVIEPSARFHLLSSSFLLTIFVVAVILYASLINHQPIRHGYVKRVSLSSLPDDES